MIRVNLPSIKENEQVIVSKFPYLSLEETAKYLNVSKIYI